jgi:GTP-binding protein
VRSLGVSAARNVPHPIKSSLRPLELTGATRVQGMSRITYDIPTRGLLGLKNALLSATKGNAVLNTQFKRYDDYIGDFTTRENGSLVAFETGQARRPRPDCFVIEVIVRNCTQLHATGLDEPGRHSLRQGLHRRRQRPRAVQVTAYAIASAQERGLLFVTPGTEVYAGQVAGIHQRAGDLAVNVCKKKALTNMRASGKDNTVALDGAREMSLDDWYAPRSHRQCRARVKRLGRAGAFAAYVHP